MPVGCRLQRPGMRRLLLAPNVERRSKAARSARPQSRLALAESLLAPPAAGPESRASMPETTTARAGKANRIESRCHCDTTHKGPGNQPGLPAGGGRGDAPPNLHREPAPSNMQPVRPRGRQDLLFFLCRFIFFLSVLVLFYGYGACPCRSWRPSCLVFLASYSPRVVYFFFFSLAAAAYGCSPKPIFCNASWTFVANRTFPLPAELLAVAKSGRRRQPGTHSLAESQPRRSLILNEEQQFLCWDLSSSSNP